MKNDQNQRIRDAIDSSGKNMSQIAREVGLTPQAVRAWREGLSLPSSEKMESLAKATGKKLEWLAFGKGESEVEELESGIISIPVFDVKASAGLGCLNFDDNSQAVSRIDFRDDWIRKNIRVANLSKLEIITAFGDSMAPTIESGELLMIDRSVNEIMFDSIYVALLNNELYVKRFQRAPGRKLVMISDNDKYRDFEISETDDLRVIGRVVYHWRGSEI